jgi:hypothetical protein
VLELDFLFANDVHVHLHDGQVGPVIVADEMRGHALLVEERDVEFSGSPGDVKIGEDPPIIIDDDARPDPASHGAFPLGVNLLRNIDTNYGWKDPRFNVNDSLRRCAGERIAAVLIRAACQHR